MHECTTTHRRNKGTSRAVEILKFVLRRKNLPNPILNYIVSTFFGTEMHQWLFHIHNNTNLKYAQVLITNLRYHVDTALPIWRDYALNTELSTKYRRALCHHVKQEFGFNLHYDTYITPITYSINKVYKAFIEGGFVPFWVMSGNYKLSRDLSRAKMHYQNYWGFGNPDFSVVNAVNSDTVF